MRINQKRKANKQKKTTRKKTHIVMTLQRASQVHKIPKFQKGISNKLYSSCIDVHNVSDDVKLNKNIGLKVVRHTRWKCFGFIPELWKHRNLNKINSMRGTDKVSLEFREEEWSFNPDEI